MSKCIIVSNGELVSDDIIIKNHGDLLIACDGGYDQIKDRNLNVDIIVGDLDSIESVPEGVRIIKLSKIKDTTDTYEAIEYGKKAWL